MDLLKVPFSTALWASDSHLGRKAEQKVINSFMGELGRRGRCNCKVNWWLGGGILGGGDRGTSMFPLPLCFMAIASLGILKGCSWVAAGPVFAQTGMMSAYGLRSSAVLQRILGARRASPVCSPALPRLNPTRISWTPTRLSLLGCLLFSV